MSGDYDYSTTDYAAAIAAAAFAVQSLDNSRTKGTTYDPDKPLNSSDSNAQVAEIVPKSSLKLYDTITHARDTPKTSFRDKRNPERAPSVKKKVNFEDIITDKPENPAQGKTADRGAPSIARSPSFTDEDLDTTDRKNPEMSLSIPDHPPIGWPMTQPVENRIKKVIKSGPGDAKADSWEKAEMIIIRERYEKKMADIENWGTRKKAQAKRKIGRIEAELDRRRVKAMQRYRDSITRIERIARGAEAQADETRRSEEVKVKEKAKRIRSTGKLPATCLCF